MHEQLKQIAGRCAQLAENRYDDIDVNARERIFEYLKAILTPAEVDGGSIPDGRIDIVVRRSPAGLRCSEPVMVLLPTPRSAIRTL